MLSKQKARHASRHEAHETAELGRAFGTLRKILETRLAELQFEGWTLRAHTGEQLWGCRRGGFSIHEVAGCLVHHLRTCIGTVRALGTALQHPVCLQVVQ